MSPPTIFSPYRIFFTTLDPLICLWGAYMDFFDPKLVLSSHIPNPSPPDVGHIMILRQRGGGMLNFGIISFFLLRHTTDLTTWRICQAAFLMVDFAYFWSVYGVLEGQGRLGSESWRAEDWGSIGIVTVATIMRVAFLIGIGVPSGKNEEKKA